MNKPAACVAELNEAELGTLHDTLEGRYGEFPELQPGAAEKHLARQDRDLTSASVAARHDADDRFDNLAEGVVNPLQVQADQAREPQQETAVAPPR